MVVNLPLRNMCNLRRVAGIQRATRITGRTDDQERERELFYVTVLDINLGLVRTKHDKTPNNNFTIKSHQKYSKTSSHVKWKLKNSGAGTFPPVILLSSKWQPRLCSPLPGENWWREGLWLTVLGHCVGSRFGQWAIATRLGIMNTGSLSCKG